MIFNEVKQDLFAVPSDYYLAHCISNDFALGAGIAVKFDRKFNMRSELKKKYPPLRQPNGYVGKALLVGRVFNLVTKLLCYNKPTYDALFDSLLDMKKQCVVQKITKIAMPKIGCGLDRLDWEMVKQMLFDTFRDTDIEVMVCSL